ncbi:2-polyprenyl-6-methoxyphenol hydroxylase-like FAD-dependent oxidoreductase [Agrobacterium vitis]|nr:2-polyprenyl-6-methoxyphenol hydroxylase-like FAD-dependent oxidoreductase [Agrobacterium vitis]MBE1440351.1 2-polyprenyl-6-methoxyphenol hydroxylase-like FAD-dependent oxidoreductase [Agrobacterium vitis]
MKIDVLIVGAGPTGSALAIDLARRGLRVRIIDRSDRSFPGSRAKGLQPRTQEVLYDLGALEDVLAAGSSYPSLGIHLGPLTLPKRMYKERLSTADVPYPNTLLIAQYNTDRILHDRMAAFGVQPEFSTNLISFDQDVDEVRASINGPLGAETVTCKFMVGADGGSSTVRRGLGIEFPGKTVESDRMIIVDAKTDGLSRKYWHFWPKLGGQFVGACPLPTSDLFQWMLRLKPGEEPDMDETALNRRIQKQTGNRKIRIYDIQWTSVFRPNIRLAEDYFKGRIFLAGDAAHVHTPAGAQGLNTGVQDAYNLGWKLAQVIAGAPHALLATYEAERQPVAAGVLGLSTQKYEAIGKLSTASIERGQDESQLSITYRLGPLVQDAADATNTCQVGDRAPDARLVDAKEASIRLFEVLRGPQFTLLAFGPEAEKELIQVEWPSTGARLKRVAIGAGKSGKADLYLNDDNASFQSIYGLNGNALILIRPDGYIGHIALQNRMAGLSCAISAVAPRDCVAA